MPIAPPLLQPGDAVYLCCPSRAATPPVLENAMRTLRAWGLRPIAGATTALQHHQLAGTDAQRAADLNAALHQPDVRAVLFLRGGYGAARIIDAIDWGQLRRDPKWLCGYSDATALLCAAAQAGVQSLHAEMAVNFPQVDFLQADAPALHPGTESLRRALFEGTQPISFAPEAYKRGTLPQAEAIGGNLSVLYSLLGSPTFPQTAGKILFLEDLDEYYYHIDRMFTALKRAGALQNLAGLVIGAFTQLHNNAVPWGEDLQGIVRDAIGPAEYPVWFGAHIGHIPQNEAVAVGGLWQTQPA